MWIKFGSLIDPLGQDIDAMQKKQIADAISAAPIIFCGVFFLRNFFSGYLLIFSYIAWMIICSILFSVQINIIKNENLARLFFFAGGVFVFFLMILFYKK